MFHVVLVQPEIPPNAGNVMRMCANSGSELHLVEPLGFELDDARMRRAGLAYRDMTTISLHRSWSACRERFIGHQMFAFTAAASQSFTTVNFEPGDVLVLGQESVGLSSEILADFAVDQRLRIPMVPGSRSINLSNSAAIAVYDAWRQNDFRGAE